MATSQKQAELDHFNDLLDQIGEAAKDLGLLAYSANFTTDAQGKRSLTVAFEMEGDEDGETDINDLFLYAPAE